MVNPCYHNGIEWKIIMNISMSNPELNRKIVESVMRPYLNQAMSDAVIAITRPICSIGTMNDRLGDYDTVYECFFTIANLYGKLSNWIDGDGPALRKSDILDGKRAYSVCLEYLTAINGIDTAVLDAATAPPHPILKDADGDYVEFPCGDIVYGSELVRDAVAALDVVAPMLKLLFK